MIANRRQAGLPDTARDPRCMRVEPNRRQAGLPDTATRSTFLVDRVELALHERVGNFGVGLAAAPLHYLSDEEAERLLPPGAVLCDRLRVGRNDLANDV